MAEGRLGRARWHSSLDLLYSNGRDLFPNFTLTNAGLTVSYKARAVVIHNHHMFHQCHIPSPDFGTVKGGV